MNINVIKIKGLFHLFDHTIRFNNEGIVIIIGENGIGKTTVLQILESIFSKRLAFLLYIDFKEIELVFSDRTWIFTKHEEGITVYDTKEEDHFEVEAPRVPRSDRRFKYQEENDIWIDTRLNKFYSREDLIERYGYDPYRLKDDVPIWFSNIVNEFHVSLIEAQRIYRIGPYDGRGSRNIDHMVRAYSEDLVNKLTKDNAEFTSKSVELDSTFPFRLLEELRRKKKKASYSVEEIRSEIDRLVDYRRLLSSVGIIEGQKDHVLDKLWKELTGSDVWSILNLYIKDNKEKLDVFHNTAERLKLLLDILNTRFKHKRLTINREKGFVVKSDFEDRDIRLEKLSSGEQNELIIFYTLLFKTDSRDIVLIDEPEISLHIAWQQNLIKDLIAIAKLTGITLVISTHSPDIIGSNWALVQKLTGK